MAAAGADKVRAASKKPQRLFVRPLRLRAGVYFFLPLGRLLTSHAPGDSRLPLAGAEQKALVLPAHPAWRTSTEKSASPGQFLPRVPVFFEKPSSCPPVTRLSRTLFHALPVFLRDAAALSGPPRPMPGVFFPAKYSHRADEICFSAAVFTVIHQKDEEAALPLR